MPAPFFQGEFILERDPDRPSCHASTIAELPDGDLIAAWYAGSAEGEKDVAVVGSRWSRSDRAWSPVKVFADTPDLSEGNPVLHVDPTGQVWLFYVTMYGEGWKSCKIKLRQSGDGGKTWSQERVIRDELGWMTRNKILVLPDADWLLPIYDETRWTSLVYISRDRGKTWQPSAEMESGEGSIQPSLVRLSDGSLLAYMRTGSETTRRLWESRSRDNGRTWTKPVATGLPNPNSAADMVRLSNGHIVLIFNNTEHGRSPLTAALSTDEGHSWGLMRDLESAEGEYSYPAVIQSRDGLIHATYTWRRERIKHVVFNEAWLAQFPGGASGRGQAGDSPPDEHQAPPCI
jgi:predicted neuraminidase